MKIAIVSVSPVYSKSNGSLHMAKNLTLMFNKFGEKTKVFSTGEAEAEIIERGGYHEKIVKSNLPSASRSKKIKVLDLLYLLLLKKRYSVIRNNQNEALFNELQNYRPDVIISIDRYFTELLIKYKRYNRDVKLFVKTDDISDVDIGAKLREEFIVNSRSNSLVKKVKLFITKLINKRMLFFYNTQYEKMLKGFDKIIFVTHEDLNRTRSKYKNFNKKMLVIPPPIGRAQVTIKKPKKYARTVLFVGGYADLKNADAIQVIKEKIAPETKELNFIVAGKGVKEENFNNFKSVGFVKDIDKLIDSADICLVPLRYGTGLKIKILDFLNHGKPIVGTSIAFEGFPVQNLRDVIICDDFKLYPNILRDLAGNYKLRKQMQARSIHLLNYFSYKTVYNQWRVLIYSKT